MSTAIFFVLETRVLHVSDVCVCINVYMYLMVCGCIGGCVRCCVLVMLAQE